MSLPRTMGNGGREHQQHYVPTSDTIEERYQRLADENRQLKMTRNEQAQALKDLNAQFARLRRDLKISTPRSGSGELGVPELPEDTKQIKALQAKLITMTKQRDEALSEVADLKERLKRYKGYDKPNLTGSNSVHSRVCTSSGHSHGTQQGHHGGIGTQINVADILLGTASGAARPDSAPLSRAAPLAPRDQNADVSALIFFEDRARRDAQTIRELTDERDSLRSQLQLNAMSSTHGQRHDALERMQALERRNSTLESELNALRERYATAAATLETASLDRDRLSVELAIAKASAPVRASGSPTADASSPLRYDSVRDIAMTSAGEPRRSPPSVSQQQPTLTRAATSYHSPTTRGHSSADAAFDEGHYESGQTLGGSKGLALRRAISEQQAQMTVLAGRFQDAQSHASALQQECERLVGELKAMHNTIADEKRRTFQLEHEKASLMVKASRVEELDLSLTLKSEELIRCEQELLRMVDRLQTCSRETESQVRLELNSRLIEAEQLREEADRQRRTKERENFTLQTESNELRRQLAAAQEDASHLKAQVTSISNDRAEIAAKYASQLASGPVDPKAAEDMVNRLMQGSAALHRSDADSLRDGAEWDQHWELAKLREMVSNQALDLELAQSRTTALERDIGLKSDALTVCRSQRDELLNENLRLREQLTGIQTALTRRDRAVLDEQAGKSSELQLQVEHIACEHDALRIVGVDDSIALGQDIPALLFVSIEGIADFEPAVSDATQVTHGEVLLPFKFPGIVVSGELASTLARDTVVLQLHRSVGLSSRVIAAGDISMGELLRRCLEDAGDATVLVPLFDGAAVRRAELTIRITVSHVALLLAAVSPLVRTVGSPSQGSHAGTVAVVGGDSQVTAWLCSFRTVSKIRVHVTRCIGLASTTTGVRPTPYVFYTATGFGGLAPPIRDTVVHASGGQHCMTADPIFDGEPNDHAVIASAALYDFLRDGQITFAVFDASSSEAESNLGTVTVPLAPLLASPQAAIVEVKALHPSGSIEYMLSWVR